MAEERLLKFYNELVSMLHNSKQMGTILFEELVYAFISAHELGDSSLCTEEFYEYILLINITSINNNGDKEEINFSPFDIIDTSYYEKMLTNLSKNILEYRRLMFMARATYEINNDPNSYAYQLSSMGRPDYLNMLFEFSKLKNILRNGWIKRSVNQNYNESDALHSTQMMALAHACFQVYNLNHLNKQKVYEMIIIHEIAETIVGDIVENTEEHLTKSERERVAIQKIFANIQNKEYFIDLWLEFENRGSEEAKFVYELDKLDPVLKARFLDKNLNRDDLFDDFYDYEDKRGTFIDTPLQKLFYSNMY